MCSSVPSALALWRTSNLWLDKIMPHFTGIDHLSGLYVSLLLRMDIGDLRYDSYMQELNEVAITVMERVRRTRHCDNLFLLDIHRVTKQRPELCPDGAHYPVLVPLFGQLIANAYALWNNPSWPGPRPSRTTTVISTSPAATHIPTSNTLNTNHNNTLAAPIPPFASPPAPTTVRAMSPARPSRPLRQPFPYHIPPPNKTNTSSTTRSQH
jgi:hypothetical protein